MALTRDNALMFLIWWRIIKSIVCKVHCYKHLLADECKRHAQLTQENEIRCQADAGKDLHPLVFRSLLDLQAAVLRLNKVQSAPWLSGACLYQAGVAGHWEHGEQHQLRRGKTGRERLWSPDDQWPVNLSHHMQCITSLHTDIVITTEISQYNRVSL